jgi:hypothetical protein
MAKKVIRIQQSTWYLVVLGALAVAFGLFRRHRDPKAPVADIGLIAGAIFGFLPLISFWDVTVDPKEKKLTIRRWWWCRTAIDLSKSPITELLVLESNTERGLWFVRIVLSDGRHWTLPSSFTKHYEELASILKECSPSLIERRSDVLREGIF